MTTINIDLEDGFPPVAFDLHPDECERFVTFMAESQAATERLSTLYGRAEEITRFGQDMNGDREPDDERGRWLSLDDVLAVFDGATDSGADSEGGEI
jgi:hypothetical protein